MDNLVYLSVFQILITLSASYVAGVLLLGFTCLKPSEKYTAFFCHLLTGLTFIVFAFSCWHTRFKTVHLGFLILAPVLFFQLKEKGKTQVLFNWPEIKEELNLLPGLFLVAFLLFGIRYWWGFGIHDYPIIHMDNNFYGKVSGYILKYGVETPRLEYIFPETAYVQPYHYYELWLNAAIYKYLGGPIVPVFYLVTYAVGIAIVWAGLCAMAARYFQMSYGIKIICFMGLFLMGVNFAIYKFLLFYPYPIRSSLFDFAKTFPIYLFLVAAILLLMKQKVREACTVLLALPVVSIITAPAVFLTLGGFSIFLFLQKKRSEALQVGLLTIVVAAFFIFFYGRATASGSTPYKSFLLSNYTSIFSADNLKLACEIFFKTFPKIIIVYAFFLGLIFSSGKLRKVDFPLNKDSVFLIVGVFVSALGTWALLNTMMNANQFFSNVGIPVVNLVILLGVVISLRVSQRPFFFVFGLVTIFLMNFLENVAILYFKPEHSIGYIQSVLKSSEKLNPIGGYIKAPEDYYNILVKSSNVYPLGNFLAYSTERADYHAISLSVFDIQLDTTAAQRTLERQLIENTSFYRFVQKQKLTGRFRSIAQSQVDFIAFCKMDYLIVSQRAKLSSLLQPKVAKLIVDPVSGEKFYVLRKAIQEGGRVISK
jgi:hypothetical protein